MTQASHEGMTWTCSEEVVENAGILGNFDEGVRRAECLVYNLPALRAATRASANVPTKLLKCAVNKFLGYLPDSDRAYIA